MMRIMLRYCFKCFKCTHWKAFTFDAPIPDSLDSGVHKELRQDKKDSRPTSRFIPDIVKRVDRMYFMRGVGLVASIFKGYVQFERSDFKTIRQFQGPVGLGLYLNIDSKQGYILIYSYRYSGYYLIEAMQSFGRVYLEVYAHPKVRLDSAQIC